MRADRSRVRLIPACAGKTFIAPNMHRDAGAHPRVCGENRRPGTLPTLAAGSSPRVRGKPGRGQRGESPCRLIPACAGKTLSISLVRTGSRAHPRVCGENLPSTIGTNYENGSSPRVRGKLGWRPGWQLSWGLIPACAGKTRWKTCKLGECTAHPRVCGENRAPAPAPEPEVGSSPRVRGKQVREPSDLARHGLIPACAGKTERFDALHRDDGAHPRVCGENAPRPELFFTAYGSSPRVRGKP